MTEPNGVTFVAVRIPEDFRPVVDAFGKKESLMPDEAILKLAVVGADCLRIHGGK